MQDNQGLLSSFFFFLECLSCSLVTFSHSFFFFSPFLFLLPPPPIFPLPFYLGTEAYEGTDPNTSLLRMKSWMKANETQRPPLLSWSHTRTRTQDELSDSFTSSTHWSSLFKGQCLSGAFYLQIFIWEHMSLSLIYWLMCVWGGVVMYMTDCSFFAQQVCFKGVLKTCNNLVVWCKSF